jgi:thiamine-phosphate pyrophosphorylase
MLDANFNRAREALRVLEDYARFVLNDSDLARQIKTDRHQLSSLFTRLTGPDAVICRDTPGDVGTTIKTADELTRSGLSGVISAAASRLTEALRVLEELAKIHSPRIAAQFEQMRYREYNLEQTLTLTAMQSGRMPRMRLMVLLTESFCRLSWEKTLDAALLGGADCIQLREKNLTDDQLLRRAMIVVRRCRAAGAISIINDRIDIALLAGADGVHLGQDDLPCRQARKLAGSQLIIGVSTERLLQARQTVRDGATYLAAGPMFSTTTKLKDRIAGPAYARELAKAQLPVPFVAIGGIRLDNLPALLSASVRAIAVSSAVISSADPRAVCRRFKSLLTRQSNKSQKLSGSKPRRRLSAGDKV